ncbi:unnamed protein product, partial [Scytosiphon promiscuus]
MCSSAEYRFVPDTEVVQHQLAQQELEGSAALSYEEFLRRLTQAVDTEVNTQLGEFTLRRHTMETLPRSIEDNPEFQAIFGLAEDSSSTVGCAEVLNTTRRTWLRLVGRRHDVQLWDMDTRVPMLAYKRPYTGRETGGESWVSAVLEPVRSRCF